MKEKLSKGLWGKDNSIYNTVGIASMVVGGSFKTMQVFRLISLLALFVAVSIYFYIHVR